MSIPPKISIITVCYNSERTIERTIQSVVAQQYENVEYLVIDGGSKDKTLAIIDKYADEIDFLVSESDNGLYDAINKGIKIATGDVVGLLHADDVFADNGVLSSIAKAFQENDNQALYGDLTYTQPNGKVLRKWISKAYQPGLFNWGWMPPHPTFYCKKEVFERLGYYDTNFGTACDYELMVRFMHYNNINTYYLNKIIVKMSVGGLSNASLSNRLRAWKNDHKAMGKNGVKIPLLALIIKPLRKLEQFF